MFTSDTASFKPLAAMRIGVGFVLLVQAYVIATYRELLLNADGPVPWTLSDSWLDPLLPKLSHLLPLYSGMGLGADAVVASVLAIHALGAAFLMVGYRTRWAAFFAWATFILIKDSSPAFIYGIGTMLLFALFYCLFAPVGREWSVDRRIAERPPAGGDACLSVMVFRVHLCIVYGASAIAKALGEQWWNGEAIWRALSLPLYQQFDLAWLAGYPVLLQALSIFTVLAQLAYPVLVWTRARVPVVAVTELIHLGIAIFLGLWLFAIMMIVLNLAAFGESLWKAVSRRYASWPARLGW